jgi:ATP-binding cassette subfamily B multidrug efflux pump
LKHLSVLNKYFFKYKRYFLFGILFILLSNYFRILSPQISGFVVDKVQQAIAANTGATFHAKRVGSYDILVRQLVQVMEGKTLSLGTIVIYCALSLLLLALLGGLFMFLMRQTIIVMSRYIEYEQKNEVFNHYQKLDINFYKTHSTGDMMNRISEDVSRVRMYTGPAIMYFINLAATIGFSIFFMLRENWLLTLYVLCPLPILALTIYFVNTIINKKSEHIQSLLSDLTTTAQESYSGIRVIKSFVQEKAMFHFFNDNSELYKKNAVGLAKVEAAYFPSMALMIGLSTLVTIAMGCVYVLNSATTNVTAGTITEFVIYVNMLTFPVSAIGWTASITQRAAASQKRLNEFLQTVPTINENEFASKETISGDIHFQDVSFTYPNTGIEALKHFNLRVHQGEKVLLLGKTGTGKTTIAQLLLRFYEPDNGKVLIGNKELKEFSLHSLREQISYVPQDVFLFSDTVHNNISFGLKERATSEIVQKAAEFASIHNEITQFDKQYETMIGERGVTLSGGQKQRISIARALIKNPEIVVFDDCLSAVDAKTESEIVKNLSTFLEHKTALIITHRIFSSITFNKIVVLENGYITEEGTHDQLLALNGYYADLYRHQLQESKQ